MMNLNTKLNKIERNDVMRAILNAQETIREELIEEVNSFCCASMSGALVGEIAAWLLNDMDPSPYRKIGGHYVCEMMEEERLKNTPLKIKKLQSSLYHDSTGVVTSSIDEIIKEAMELDFYSLEEKLPEMEDNNFSRLFLEV